MYIRFLLSELLSGFLAEARRRPVAAFLPLVLAILSCLLGTVFFLSFGEKNAKQTLGKVSGVVLVNGDPVAGVTVRFEPFSGDKASEGVTDGAGWYELSQGNGQSGAVIGPHRVRLSTGVVVAGEDGSESLAIANERIPDSYNQASVLEATVNEGANVLDWKLSVSEEYRSVTE